MRYGALVLTLLAFGGLALLAVGCGGDDGGPSDPVQAGSIQVTATTTGADLDADGYTATLDGGSDRSIGLNGVTTFSDVGVGQHQVELTGIADNCSVSGGNPAAASVTAGSTASVSFNVLCEATSGSLEITTVVTNNFDPNGFEVRLGGIVVGTVAVNVTEEFPDLSLGSRSLELTDVAPNCAVEGVNPRDVTIIPGQTASETFSVTCNTPPDGRIVYFAPGTGAYDIWVSNVDGTGATNLTDDEGRDLQPAWSPDGERIAFASDRDGGDYDIYVMNKDASGIVRLTSHSGSDLQPTWSPDGTKLAFASDRDGSLVGEIFLVNDDGTGLTQLTRDLGGPDNTAPSWSPDGQRIAFVGGSPVFPGEGESIYTVAVDGTDLVRLTDPCGATCLNGAPDWSPDGSRVAFHRQADWNNEDIRLMVMNADGTNPIDITPAGISEIGWPAWSPDGGRIVASGWDGFWVMDADGSNAVQQLAGAYALEPDWGP